MTARRPAPAGDEPQVLAFVAPWCGACRRLEPALDEAAVDLGGDVRLVKIRVDEQPDDVERFGVRATPTTVALRGDVEVARVVGAMSRTEIDRLFEAARTPSPVRVRTVPPRVELALRLGVGAVLALAGVVLHQVVLIVIGALVAGSTVLVVRAARRPTRASREPTHTARGSRP